MGSSIVQAAFTSGELSPSLYGRIDFAKYYTGLKTCKNFIIRPQGGVSNRPGLRYICDTKGSAAARLIPFQFSNTQTYVLEFTPFKMRIICNIPVNGVLPGAGLVVYPVGHAQAGQVVEVTTIYPATALADLSYAQTADVMTICHPDYPPQQLSRTDHHAWTFAAFVNVGGPFLPMNITASLTISASAVTGNVTLTASAAAFTASMIGQMIQLEQSPDAMVGRWEVGKTIAINDVKRAGSNYYQAVASGTTGTVTPDHLEGLGYDGDPGVPWQYLHSGRGIVRITGFTSATVVTGVVINRLPEKLISGSSTKTITNIIPGAEVPLTNVRATIVAHGWSSGDSITVAGVGGTVANGVWQIIVIDANTFDLSGCISDVAYTSGGTATKTLTASPTYKWAIEAWGGASGYPSIVGYYLQRQIFGATKDQPQTVWLSTVTGYTDFSVTVPSLDDDAITVTLASREVNVLKGFVELSELVTLTTSGEWLMKGDQNGVLTPASTNMKRQGFGGSAGIAPLIVGSAALYIQEKGAQIRTLSYSLTNDSYVGNDMTITAGHLFNGHQITAWTYQRSPFQTIWCVREDGVLLALAFMPEHEVAGWSQHNTIDGTFEAITCISEGMDDAVYVVVKRGAKRFVERMDTRRIVDVKDSFFVDSGLTYSGDAVTTMSGLDHLEGKTVDILADGFVLGQQVVTSGAVTLEHSASTVHVGLPIISEIETLPISAAGSSIRDKNKLIHHVSILVDETSGLFVGPDADHLSEEKQRTDENYGEPTRLTTGMVDIRVQSSWDKVGQVMIRKAQPLPVTILAVIPEVTTAGS